MGAHLIRMWTAIGECECEVVCQNKDSRACSERFNSEDGEGCAGYMQVGRIRRSIVSAPLVLRAEARQ
jgi:hypothetical protein